MNVYEKIIKIGKNFNHKTYVIFEIKGNTGRIIDYTPDKNEVQSYFRIAKKNGLKIEAVEYDPADGLIYNVRAI